MVGSLCFCAKAVGPGSLVTFYMSEWLVGCSNTHQPPIIHSISSAYLHAVENSQQNQSIDKKKPTDFSSGLLLLPNYK